MSVAAAVQKSWGKHSLSTCPEGKDLVQAPGEIVSRVGVNGLKEAQRDPHELREQHPSAKFELTPAHDTPS